MNSSLKDKNLFRNDSLAAHISGQQQKALPVVLNKTVLTTAWLLFGLLSIAVIAFWLIKIPTFLPVAALPVADRSNTYILNVPEQYAIFPGHALYLENDTVVLLKTVDQQSADKIRVTINSKVSLPNSVYIVTGSHRLGYYLPLVGFLFD